MLPISDNNNNNNTNNYENKKSKQKKILLFTIITLISLIVVTVLTFAFFIAFSKSGRRIDTRTTENVEENSEDTEDTQEEIYGDNLPSKTVFAIYGVDKGEALADVIIVASFDRVKNTINTISIPRDTYVEMSEENRKELREKGKKIPSGGMKINAVHSLSGEYGNEYLSRQIEELLDIHIDYYFEINLNAFIEIVDAIDGVEVDVPTSMYYRDPTQNLYINIKKGKQTLDGKTAQGFVRFRQYKTGDIQRIEMQKLFLKALLSKITNSETLISNLPELISIFIENTNTNMTIKDALDYAPFIRGITSDKITMGTLPGDGHTPYRLYDAQTRSLVNRLFFDVN